MDKEIGIGVVVAAIIIVASMVLIPQAIGYDDLEYSEWTISMNERFAYYGNKIVEAMDDKDMVSLKVYSSGEYDLCLEALDEIDQFEVTPGTPLSLAKEENKAAWQDQKWASYYTYKAADSYLSGDTQGCIDYLEKAELFLESATDHTKKASKILEEEAISPTPTLQAEKDSDGDGVPDEYDYAPNDPNVQTKDDVKTPGFGATFAICSLLAIAFAIKRRR